MKAISENINSKDKSGGRITIIDFVRGLAIIVMVIYHLLFTMGDVFGFTLFDKLYEFFKDSFLVDLFASIFVIICGVSSSFTRGNPKRSLKTFIVASSITIVTCFIMPLFGYKNLDIYFGILHFLSFAMLISPVLIFAAKKIKGIIAVPLCLIFYYITDHISYSHIILFSNPINIHETPVLKYLLYPLGTISTGLRSVDYYPILPWIFIFIIGIYAGIKIKNTKLPDRLYQPIFKPFEWCGRRTLYIYIAHQPIIFLIGLLIDKIF